MAYIQKERKQNTSRYLQVYPIHTKELCTLTSCTHIQPHIHQHKRDIYVYFSGDEWYVSLGYFVFSIGANAGGGAVLIIAMWMLDLVCVSIFSTPALCHIILHQRRRNQGLIPYLYELKADVMQG